MIYSRCYNVLAIQANEGMRAAYPVSRGMLKGFVGHTCNQMGCWVHAVSIGSGYVVLLIDLNCNLSLESFVSQLKSITSRLITSAEDKTIEYWNSEFWFRAVSPQDKDSAIRFIGSLLPTELITSVVQKCALHYCPDKGEKGTIQTHAECHHIILIELKGRVKLPLKWRFALADLVKGIVYSDGIKIRDCAAMRNHVHILCNISISTSLSQTVDELKTKILEQMHANLHFRRFEGWYPDEVAYAIADHKYGEEEHQLCTQDTIHPRRSTINEMSFLYRKLDISYVVSLR